MAILKNLEATELLVMLDRKRHLKLAAAGDPGDEKEVDDRHLLPDRSDAKVIQDLVLAGKLEIVPGSQSSDISSIAVGQEQWPGMEGFDEVVDLEGAAGVSVDVGPLIPATAMLLSVQCNIEELVVAGGTSVAVGVGLAADPDKYNLTADLLKNSKGDHFFTPPLAALGGAEQLAVNMATGAGLVGDTAATAGKVRVRARWIAASASLPDAV